MIHNATTPFATHIMRLRVAHGLSMQALADRVGVSKVTIWKWEKGDHTPRSRFVLPLARALNVQPEQLQKTLHTSSVADDSAMALSGTLPYLENQHRAPTAPLQTDALAEVILRAKLMIADASGTSPENVTISIEF